MLVNKLLKSFQIKDYKEKNVEFYGNNKTSKLMSIYSKYLQEKQVCVIVSSKKEAEELQSELLSLTGDVYLYPEIDVLRRFTNKSNDLEQVSIQVLNKLLNKEKTIVILTVNSLFRTLKNPEDYMNNILKLSLENYIEFSNLPNLLVNMGYQRVDTVENIGEYSKRGSIIDIYSPLYENPIRLDYFDEELDSIRVFRADTQQSIDKINSIKIYPTSDFFLSREEKDSVVDKLERELKKINSTNNSNYNEIKLYIENKIKLYRDNFIFDELEAFSNYIYDKTYSIVDYMDNNACIFFDNYSKIEDRYIIFKEEYAISRSDITTTYIHQKTIDEDAFNKIISMDCYKYNLSLLKSSEKLFNRKENIFIRDLEFLSNSEQINKYLVSAIESSYEIVVLLHNKKQRDYFEKVLFDYNLFDHISVGIFPGKIHIEESSYQLKGFINDKDKFLLITPVDLFQNLQYKKKRISFKFSNSEKIRNYQDLNVGDYIVHIHHGIGSYQGIENIEVNNVHKDFLKIVYDGGDIIYVDIDNMKYVQKYSASDDNKKPKLNKLGTKKWQQTKSKVKKEVEDISEELIKTYIKRELNKGYAFSSDGYMQKEFEQDFMFTPTEDQLKATAEIKEDMEKIRPMDRLLCGDVGFGKTEVAMRVSFKAVVDNKQVAILVPTTLLAEQHYENFKERFINFPINIEVVSRFKTSKEIKEIEKKLLKGEIDIIIGTHKLLNDKFKYKDLGLLIIDEEQRFGVKHKEKIKHLKNMIDVLTLSATPIPRTLHMSLIGIRDLSVIETPPINRQPIQTFVARENPQIIREAVLKEIERNGQIFYVYNKVESIEEKYLELKKLLPEINIAYAHGRMSQKELENIMTDIINKEYDMLITTTIIETGIDISNVNTLIVEDADKFGLSQLYQLRGRVGRSSREAYAYLLYKPFKLLTENSEKRLAAIKNFTSLGSGFKIAMQDLSIRGAGDTLGSKQHGFIDSVGYTLYSQMLEEELSNKKEIIEPILKNDTTKSLEYYENIIKEKTKNTILDLDSIEDSGVKINLNIDAYIPKDYISKDADKLYFYKSLNNATTENEINDIVAELIDRFSDFNKEVENLIDICFIKLISEKIFIERIFEKTDKIVIDFKKEVLEFLNGAKLLEQLIDYKDISIQVKDKLTIYLPKRNYFDLKKILKILKLIEISVEV